MTITAPDTRITSYSPVVPTTDFAASFPVFDNDDLKVFVNGVERDDFAVSATYAEGISTNAKAVFAVGVTGTVLVVGARDPHRTNRFVNGAPIPVRDFNLALDTIEGEMQEARRDIGRSLKVPYGDDGIDIFPGSAGQVPVFDADGNLFPGTPAGGGNMFREIYDPQAFGTDVFQFVLDHLVSIPSYVETRVALKAIDTTKITLAILREAGREGIFKWTAGDFTAQIASDTSEGIYLKANAIAATAGAWVRIFTGSADIRWFGAIGDGTTDDTAAVNAAFAAGIRVGGRKRTYAVSGDVNLPAALDLEDATFKQLTPNNAARKTLYANGVNNITLKRVKVDRNGSGLSGGLNTAAGIWIDGGSLHTVDDCEVFGSDAGAGMVFNGCSNFKVNRPYVHDILYVAASLPADDQCMAILFNGCSNFSIFEPRINHLGGIVGGSFRRAFGRMLCFGFGCSQFRVYGGQIEDGDVGIDLSGSKGNTFYSVIGVTVRNVETWGIKQSNYNRFGRIVGCDVYRAGSAGYVLSGPTVNVDPDTTMPDSAPKNITIMGCGAWQTGVGNTGRGTSQPAGFLIIPGGASSYQDYPRGIRFVSCTAVDNQTVKTQYHGFRNEISYGGVPLNEMVDCRSEGYASGGQHSAGFHYPACRVYNSGAVTVPNNTTTAIGFDSEDYDGAAMHSTSVNNDAIFVPHPGWYHIDAEATVVANATGSRFLGITQGGVSVPRLRDQQPGTSANDHTLKLSGDIYVSDVAGGIRLTLLQNSGGNLNVLANASLSVRQVLFN
jgi:hypothetical protein